METKRYKPMLDKLFYILSAVTLLIVATPTVVCGILAPTTLFIMIPICLFTAYFFVTTLFGYVELRESTVYIRYGFIMKREIPYSKIRKVEKERSLISPSINSIKNSIEHVNIKYNTFDITTVSVKGNDELIRELNERCGGGMV